MKLCSSSADASPNSGKANSASTGKPFIAAMMAAAQRQEALIDALVQATEDQDNYAILQAVDDLVANRRKDSPIPQQRKKKTDNPKLPTKPESRTHTT